MNDPLTWRDERLGAPATATLSSGPLRYHDTGGAGLPVIVFAHGYLVNANIWRKLVPLLRAEYRCITPDLPLGSHVAPVNRDADLSPPGIAAMIAELMDTLDLREVTLFGNDSGGAYSQVVAAWHPERLARLVLATCETPECTWPPTPGGFGLLKATAVHPASYRALYQVLRLPRTWRWRNTYGWLAKYPIEAPVMWSYLRPVLDRAEIRHDGRKAIGAVSARYSRAAANRLVERFDRPVLLLWAEEDHVFPVANAERYAARLRNAELVRVRDSYTYLSEDQPDAVAKHLRDWFASG